MSFLPSTAAPPRVAISSTSQAVIGFGAFSPLSEAPCNPARSRAISSACRTSASMCELSLLADPSTPKPTGIPSRRYSTSGANPEPGACWKMGNAQRRSRIFYRCEFLQRLRGQVRQTDVLSQPVHRCHIIDRLHPKLFDRERFFILRLRQMGVQMYAVLPGEFCTVAHQFSGYRERRTGAKQFEAWNHGWGRGIFLLPGHNLPEYYNFGVYYVIRRQSAFGFSQAH